ncbi:hypothetical protein [Paracoccus sp. S-4012]|uniref:hypothetical protein n=1 Tax=Paracoccus sp. S-4012 TaxID=2665648 RepID=UPI0018A1C69C|nr:hypothetical protein [Paracoccus sp. S-4012]
MIVLAALILGAVLGWRRAAAIGGNTKDRVQYAAVHAILFALLGMFATILVDRALR